MNKLPVSPRRAAQARSVRVGIAMVSISLLSACAVTQKEVEQRFESTQNSALQLDQAQRAAQAVQQAPVVMVNAPYISSRSVSLAKEVRLPSVFKSSSSFARPKSGAGFSLVEVADLISKRYGIRVRIRSDAFLPTSDLIPGGGEGASSSSGTLAPSGAASGAPAAGSAPRSGMSGGAPSSGSVPTAQYGQLMDFDFTGSLNEYLQRLSAVTGLSTEWDDGTQELLFYRLVTKTFTLDTTPSTQTTQTSVTKSSTGAGAMGAASGSANSQTAMDSDTWAAVEKALNTFKTKAGSVVVNRGTRSITVIDTKDVIEMASRFMSQQNEVLSRQAVLSVKLIRVSLARDTQEGINLNLAFQRYIRNSADPVGLLNTGAGGSLVRGGTGNLTYTVLANGSRSAAGTDVVASFMNEIGKVTDEYSQDIPVRNNRTVPVMDFSTFGYLAKTTAATGGTGGIGSPGLETSTVTSGTLLLLTPSIKSDESLVLSLGLDRTNDPTFDTISVGAGATFQQVQLVRQKGIKLDTEIGMKNQETLIIMGLTKDSITGGNQWGLTGASSARAGNREVQFLIITPKIIGGGA